MPELPEVETIKRELLPRIRGRVINRVLVRRREIIGFPTLLRFKRSLLGRKITGGERRGKYLILKLDDGKRLVFHLKLSGRLLLVSSGTEVKHERIRFRFSNSKVALVFVEPRMFGRVYLVGREIPRVLKGFAELGPEHLTKDFNFLFLKERLAKRKAKIKPLLLDQRLGCGLGNIYADEALFSAKIHPLRAGASLTRFEVKRLVRSIKKVLKEAIGYKGTTRSDYFRPNGRGGGYQWRLRVKDRAGEPCFVCGAKIEKIKVSNRTTHFCPRCQG